MSIHDVLLAQRRERELVRTAEYVERSSVIEAEAGGRIRVVVGPRRAGKSSYAMHKTSGEAGGWGYANFDDPFDAAAESPSGPFAGVAGVN